MGKGFQHVTPLESKLILNMMREEIPWDKIHKVTGRSISTLSRIKVAPRTSKKAKPKGAPVKATKKEISNIVKSLASLLKGAKAQKEVTAAMVRARAGTSLCEKRVRQVLHGEGIRFYRLKERPILTNDDLAVRLKWANTRKRRSKDSWLSKPHAIIDDKNWQIFNNKDGRQHAARRSVRGAYQQKGQNPSRYVVKPKKHIKYPAKTVRVTAAVIKGRVRMWEYVPKGKKWNGATAAAMYEGPLVKALSRAYPEHAKKGVKWIVLEDNDPAGYKSGKAMTAKRKAGVVTDDLPRRSPDLNVLDYSLWHTINMKMREQERLFSPKKKESEEEYKARLKKTALGLPTTLVKKAVMDMHRRVRMVIKAGGDLFNE